MLCVKISSYTRSCGGVSGGISDIGLFDPADFNFTQGAAVNGVLPAYSAMSLRSGAGAAATAAIIIGAIISIAITNAGTGYTSAPTVTFTGGGGTGAAATAIVAGGIITGITITNVGSGYTSAPTVGFTGGAGTGGAATATINSGVSSITVSNGGSGYNNPPVVTLTGGGGTGATATATVVNGVVTAISITAPGSGYTSAPTVAFSGGGADAANGAKVYLQSFEIDEAEWKFANNRKGSAAKYDHEFNLQVPESSQGLTNWLQMLDAASTCCGIGLVIRLNSGKIFIAGERYVNSAQLPRFTIKQDGSSGGSGKVLDDLNGANIVLKGSYSRSLYEYSGTWDSIIALT